MDIEGKLTSHGEIIVKQKRNKNIVNVFKSYAVDEDLTHRFAVPRPGSPLASRASRPHRRGQGFSQVSIKIIIHIIIKGFAV